jgi:hypothetical protein
MWNMLKPYMYVDYTNLAGKVSVTEPVTLLANINSLTAQKKLKAPHPLLA